MAPYDVYLHTDLLEKMPAGEAEREAIMKFIRGLASQPHATGDFIEQDVSLRPQQVKVIGNYAVTFWTDTAVRKVMVVDIRSADC
jgi:hypothetical protein